MNYLSKKHVLEGFKRARNTQVDVWRDNLPTWCPGCGHFTGLQGLYEALQTLSIDEKDLAIISGIGCSGRFPFFIRGFGFNSLHGRALPIAVGVKAAKPKLTVVVVGGDGDGLGIGGGHLPHAIRNNFDITYILLDNSIYGLTKGQVSPTSPLDMVTATTPYGNTAKPLNPCALALTYGATFISRVFSKNRRETSDIITKAISHKGFSLVHLISPCIEFNKTVTYKSVDEKISSLPEDYTNNDFQAAYQYINDEVKTYTGVFYIGKSPTFYERMQSQINKQR